MNEHACEGAGGPGAGTRGGYGASLPGVKGAGSLSRVGLGATRLGGVLALLVGLTGALAAPAASQSSRTPAFAGDAAATPGSAWSIQPTPDQTVPNGALLSSSCTCRFSSCTCRLSCLVSSSTTVREGALVRGEVRNPLLRSRTP